MANPRTRVVAALGTAQTLAWASSYYLPAMLATPMARDLGIPTPLVFGAFSVALVASAFVGPSAGRAIDHRGGRVVLAGTSLLFALGLTSLSLAQNTWGLFGAWLVIGIAMGAGLYEAAFASLVRLYGHDARGAITGITLIAGFASTVGWPLSAWMESQYGWRGACLGWAAFHVLLGLPLNWSLPPANGATTDDPGPVTRSCAGMPGNRPAGLVLTTTLLSFVFAATWFISTAMAAHLPRLLEATGASLAAAVVAGALIGPAQVAGRIMEFSFLRRVHPLLSARLAAAAHPVGVAMLLIFGPVAAPAFALFHGAGNGILTIAKGTLPLVLFGATGYGARQGWLMMPARVTQAAAPFIFGWAIDAWAGNALWLSGGIALAACAALLVLQAKPSAAANDRTTNTEMST